jgi:hypothetical protein
MKTLILSLALLFGMTTTVYAEVEKTKVCVDVKDKAGQPVKDAKGKVRQNCKEMKVHKKLEGTAVPVKK